MFGSASITLTKLDIECQLPAGLENASGIAGRLTTIARTKLTNALADRLQALDTGGEEIVLIKSLQLDMDIDLLLSEQQISHLWATKMKKALLQAISAAGNSGMVVFSSPVSYLRAALLDMVRGRAQQLWYYRYFNGLWSLPLSAALRTALLNEPEQGLAALAQMQHSELVELCGAFNNTDAQRVLAALFSASVVNDLSVDDAQVFVSSIANVHSLAHSVDARPSQQVLLLASLALHQQSRLNTEKLRGLAECFSQLMHLRYRHMDSFHLIMEALLQRRPSHLKPWLSATQITELTQLLHVSAEVLQCLAQPLVSAMPMQQKTTDINSLQNSFTWFGNALLLLPQINNLPLHKLAQWPALKKQPALALVRWLVLCVCQGADKFSAAVHDPLLRELCGLAPHVSLTEIVAWLNEQLTLQQLTTLYAQLKQQVITEGHADEQPLQCFQWQHENKHLVVHGDTQKGCWLNLQIDILNKNLMATAQQDNSEQQSQAMADFATLWPNERFHFSDAACACLTVLAQFSLKSFAYRLPGFARCSVKYLLQNFLSMSATLVAEEQHIDAFLSRVPMSVMLNMAGMNRGNIQLPDFDPRPIRLREPA